MTYVTPLRYPGGKGKLATFIKRIFDQNDLLDGHYVEPYAGGAAVGLSLLFAEYATHIHINDIDPSVYAFWHSVLHETEQLCRLIRGKRVSMAEWKRQKAIQKRKKEVSLLELGFSTFFLNRANRSGIIKGGGVIGGNKQTGKWKMNARFNKQDLIARIEKIAAFRDRISLYNTDAAKLLKQLAPRLPRKALLYLDPPYFVKGHRLYANFYRPEDHVTVAMQLAATGRLWIVTYDNAEEIKQIYRQYPKIEYGLNYSARNVYRGAEVMFFSPGLKFPRSEPLSVGHTSEL
jgi:DNA adenine methylase